MVKRIIILAVILVAAVVGFNFQRQGTGQSYAQDNVRSQLDRFVEAFSYVKQYYVESVESEKLISGAIQGMLSELDPHSVYIPKKEVEKVTEEVEGFFEGIGIEFVVQNKNLTVVSPIVGGPSEAVGLLPGDQIVRIDGESAYGITEAQVLKKLRGPKGSQVALTIRRPGQPDTFDVVIVRDKIPIYSVIAAFMLDDGKTGYVYLGRFAKTTNKELDDALTRLEKEGMESLILDLRFNVGGLLDQAIEVADRFVPGGHRLVYTRGRVPGSSEDFYSSNRTRFRPYPLVVMINHGSASASEIVAGAVQDLDRGLVVGQTSFGKGLVQNQRMLRDGSAMRLTIARYYTPSGRLIQRPFDNGVIDYYLEAYEDERQEPADSARQIFLTLAGREVYGGGGITPDTILTDLKITRFTGELIRKRIFFEIGSSVESSELTAFQDFPTFNSDFVVGEKIIGQIATLCEKYELPFSQEALDKDRDYIATMIKAEIARNHWGSEAYYQIRVMADPEVLSARELIPEATRVFSLHDWNIHTH
ncbi:S41 family peptidase [candidate division KSB1 bacterium]|nr:S41 family peptidase [candidate division KSB1 bacterium]